MENDDSEDISQLIEDAKEIVDSGSSSYEEEDKSPTEKELLKEIKRLSEALSRTPKKSEMGDLGEYSPWLYIREFGSWNEAVEEAGMEPNRRQLSDEELLDNIRQLADELDRPPNSTEIQNQGDHGYKTYIDRFGSWEEALVEAGFDPDNAKSRGYSEEELLAEINRLGTELGRPPTMSQMNKMGEYSPSPYRERFDSWDDALRKAGLDPSKKERISKEDLTKIDLPQKAPDELLEGSYVRLIPSFENDKTKIKLKPVDNPLQKNDIKITGNSIVVPKSIFSALGLFEKDIDWQDNPETGVLSGIIDHDSTISPEETRISQVSRVEDPTGTEAYEVDIKVNSDGIDYLFLSFVNIDNNPGLSLVPASEEDSLLPGVVQVFGSSDSLKFYIPKSIGDAVDMSRSDSFEFFPEDGILFLKLQDKDSSLRQTDGQPEPEETEAVGDQEDETEEGPTQQDLISELRDLRYEVGKTPSRLDMNTYGNFNSDDYVQEFGSWESAIKQAELNLNGKIDDEEILKELRRVNEEREGNLTSEDIDTECKYGSTVYRIRFDSLDKAIDKIRSAEGKRISEEKRGAADTDQAHELTDQYIEERLERSCVEVTTYKKVIETRLKNSEIDEVEIADRVDCRVTLVRRALNKHEELVNEVISDRQHKKEKKEAAEPVIEDEISSRQRGSYTDEELIQELVELNDSLEKPPSRKDIQTKSPYSVGAYQNHFGSLKKALEQAGIETWRERFSEEEMLEGVREVADKLGRSPSAKDMRIHGSVTPQKYSKIFGSWEETLGQAGLNHWKDDFDDSDVIKEIIRVAEELNKVPSNQDMNKNSGLSNHYDRYFDSWTETLRQAGYRRRNQKGEKIPDKELLEELCWVAAETTLGDWEKLCRLRDIVRLQPTNIKELSEEWGIDSKMAKQYLRNELNGYYNRMSNGLHATNEAENLVDNIKKISIETKHRGDFHPQTYRERFGSIENAIKMAFRSRDEK